MYKCSGYDIFHDDHLKIYLYHMFSRKDDLVPNALSICGIKGAMFLFFIILTLIQAKTYMHSDSLKKD